MSDSGEAQPAVTWRRVGPEILAAAFLVWVAVVALNAFAFGDPAARAAVSANLSHLGQIFTHVPRNAPLAVWLLATLVAGIGPGDALLRGLRFPARDAFERIAFGAVAGLGILIALAYLLASVQALRPVVEWIFIAGGFVYSVFSMRRWLAEAPPLRSEIVLPRALGIAIWTLLIAELYVCLLGALTPEVQYDARYYHLTQAHRYAQHGGFYNILAAERLWAYALPHYQETLYAFGWVLFGHIGAKIFAWGDAVVTVLAIVAFARRWFGVTEIGALAALILFSSPVVAWSTTTANNDLAAVPFVLLAMHGMLLWRTTGARGPLLGAGLFAGFTYGIKSFGLVTVAALGLIILWTLIARRTALRSMAIELSGFAAAAFVAMLPALATAAWMIGDPVFPFATELFSAKYGGVELMRRANISAAAAHAGYLRLDKMLALPWTLTFQVEKYRDLVGPTWLATMPLWVGLPFLARRGAEVLRPIFAFVALVCVALFVTGVIELRYVAMTLPFVALLIAYFALRVGRAARSLVAVLAVALLAFTVLGNELVTPLQHEALRPAVMGPEYLNFAYLYEGLPESDVQLVYVPAFQYAAEHMDPLHDKIYDGVKVIHFNAYSEIPLFDGVGWGSPDSLHEWNLLSPDAYAHLKQEQCTYAFLPQELPPRLKTTPVWSHLRFVADFAAFGVKTKRIELYKIVD